TGYAEVVAVLRDPRFSADKFRIEGAPELLQTDYEKVFRTLSLQMVFIDPPDHTRLRGLVTKAFTPRVVESMRMRIQAITDALLEAAAPQGHMDVIRDLAYPLPVTVIAEMLGVPLEDRDRFKKWSDDFFAFLEGRTTAEQERAAAQSLLELRDYFLQ